MLHWLLSNILKTMLINFKRKFKQLETFIKKKLNQIETQFCNDIYIAET